MWKFIENLKKQQAMTELDKARIMMGEEKAEKASQARRNARIESLVGRYENDGDLGHFLRGIAHNYIQIE